MKRSLITVAVFTLASSMVWAQDGAALYKAKCAACHGAAGEGKVGPSLQKTTLSQEQITDLLTKGLEGKKAPHGKAVSGLTADQAAAIATYVGTLKK
jgi:mono/diheme cytochrome c family protein